MKQAKRILEDNWTGAYTKPSPGLYPHQWNWDSGFIAMGYAHYDEKRAMQELRSLFQNQWENGMVPQIVFNPEALGHYFPEPDFWQVPDGRLTSGITMPPLHAIACLHIYEHAKSTSRALDVLREIFSNLVSLHRYLYLNRDPEKSGLAYIRHPWESGLDNSPAWDVPIGNVVVDRKNLPPYRRKDLEHGVPAEQRPSDADYDRYVYLVDLFRRHGYREDEIYRECPFLVQDVLFNAILCRANRDLSEIGRIIGEDVTEVEEWQQTTSKAIREKMWCPECRKFESIDLVAGEHIHTATAASFMPLFSGAASEEQSGILYESMNSISFCALRQGNCFTIPNYDMTREDFDARNYWRGPVWININWMLSQGLKEYGYREKSDAIRRDMIQLPIRFGFYEFFDSQTGKGYGAPGFSWTAALFLDLIYEYYERDPGYGKRTGKRHALGKKTILNLDRKRSHAGSSDPAGALMASITGLRDRFCEMGRGLVDYEAMKGSPEYERYRDIAGSLRFFNPKTLSPPEEKKAFWVNLYNTIVIHGIVELGLTASVTEVADFFINIAYNVGDYQFSPDDMEHGILRANARPPYRMSRQFAKNDPRRSLSVEEIDPRIHFALVCGSRSCPPIRFYEAEKIDLQLDAAAESFVNSSEVIILPERNKIFLSQIFHWYGKDFGTREAMFSFLMLFLADREKSEYLEEHMNDIKVEYLFYDWNLNH